MANVIASGFMNRNIVEHLMSDRSRQYRCNTLQNPLAYVSDGKLLPVSITDVSDGYTDKAKGIYLRDKSIVSVGMKKADDPYKFIGFRPDEKQDGSEQFEISLESVEVNGKSQTIDLSQKSRISEVAHDLGPLIVQSVRQRTRLMLPLTNADEGFKIAFRLHLKGLKIVYRDDLDEYWIFNVKGQFRFRLGKPYLVGLGEESYEPLDLTEYDRPPVFVVHSLKDMGDGTYLYIKEPGPDFGKLKLPEKFWVDADTVYSSTADGYVMQYNATWSTVHNATTGYSVFDTLTNANTAMACYLDGDIVISRSFFFHDLSALSGTVTACAMYLRGSYASTASSVSIQKGTASSPLTVDAYNDFSGVYYAKVGTWVSGAYNTLTMNATGITDVQSALGTTMNVCAREYAHDYCNSSSGSSSYREGVYYAEYTSTARDPYLYITITASGLSLVGQSTLIGGRSLVGPSALVH